MSGSNGERLREAKVRMLEDDVCVVSCGNCSRLIVGVDQGLAACPWCERDDARDWVRRLTQETRVLTCAFCGEAYPPNMPASNHELLLAHVRVCAKHPMREAEKERDDLRIRLSKLTATAEKSFELNQEMIVYPDVYFRQKWRFEETLAEIAAELGKEAPKKVED